MAVISEFLVTASNKEPTPKLGELKGIAYGFVNADNFAERSVVVSTAGIMMGASWALIVRKRWASRKAHEACRGRAVMTHACFSFGKASRPADS